MYGLGITGGSLGGLPPGARNVLDLWGCGVPGVWFCRLLYRGASMSYP